MLKEFYSTGKMNWSLCRDTEIHEVYNIYYTYIDIGMDKIPFMKKLPTSKHWRGRKFLPSTLSIRLLEWKQKTLLYPVDGFQLFLDPVILVLARMHKEQNFKRFIGQTSWNLFSK